MSKLIITGLSSIASANAGALRYAQPTRACSVSQCRPTRDALAQAVRLPLGCSYPVELLSDMDAPRHRSSRWITRRVTGVLPANSMVRLDAETYMTTPEYFFLTRSRHLSFVHALQLAMELCGGYSTFYSQPYQQMIDRVRRDGLLDDSAMYPPDEWGLDYQQSYDLMHNGYVNRRPISSAAKLRRYVIAACGESRKSVARKVVDWVQDGSRSPGETSMYLLACLPPRYGGCRLTPPILNARINLSPEASLLTRARYFEADMLWKGAKVIGEYDGRVHSDDDRRLYDDERRLALNAMGYKVFVLDRASLRDDMKMDAFVKKVAKETGQRLYTMRDPGCFALKRRELKSNLFDYSFDLYRSRKKS